MDDDYTVSEHWMPYPEIVAEASDPYEIIDSTRVSGLPSNGMADKVNRVLYVPLEAQGRVVSRHELAHVLWSPTRLPRVRGFAGTLQALEDARINRGLQNLGLGLELDASQIEEVRGLGRHDLEHGPEGVVTWALRTVASFGTNVEGPLLELAEGPEQACLPLAGASDEPLLPAVRAIVLETRRRLDEAQRRSGADVADFERVRGIARWLARQLRRLGLPEPKGRAAVLCCLGAGPLPRGSRRTTGRKIDAARLLDAGSGSVGRPGRMRVATPVLPDRCAPAPVGLGRGSRASDEGTELRYIPRYAYDYRVFRRRSKRRRGGGSVLIDVSGSMSLDAKDIDRIIADAPGATLVAIYSGRGNEGELRVVVREGRRSGVGGLEPFGGANVVDVPALEWLAKQRAPRVWISDGGVTGCGDRPSPKIERICRKICSRARIARVGDADGAAKALASPR